MSVKHLQWVHDEIRARLNDARLAVEAHAGAPDEWQHLQRCAALVDQIHRVLALVRLHGCALLVEETGALAHDLIKRRVECSTDTHEALMRALVDIASHLERLCAGWREHPLDLLQMVNDLRGARGVPLLSPGALFAPPLWSELPDGAVRGIRIRSPLVDVVRRLRTLYQAALLAVLRAGESGARDALLRMDEILERMEMLAARRPALRQWWVARALVQDLAAGEIELTIAVKRILGQLDIGMRDIIRDGAAVLDVRPSADLLRHMLYYVADSHVHEGRSGAVKSVFELDRVLTRRDGTATITGHAAALGAVAGPLQEQLAELEQTLDSAQNDAPPEDLAPRVRQLAVTFGLLGANDLRETLRARAAELQEDANVGHGTSRYLTLAEDLLRARAVVASLTRPGAAGIPDTTQVANLRHSEAAAQAMAQVRRELFVVKEGLSAYATGEAVPASLGAVADGIERSAGVLRLVGYRQTAALAPWVWVLRGAARHADAALERRILEQLARAILDVESALERGDAKPPQRAESAPRRAAPARALDKSPVRDPAPDRPSTASVSVLSAAGDDDDLAMDEELKAVFAEEMTEVIQTLRDVVPRWSDDPSRGDALLEIRRAFHTLKGSGRVVGAVEVGDFASSVEQVLNRVLDGSMGPSSQVSHLVSEAAEVLPEVLGAFASGVALPDEVGTLRQRAQDLAA